MNHYLITGGAGFIGSHLAKICAEQGTVTVLDNLRTGHRKNLRGLPLRFLKGSILHPESLAVAMEGVTHVFHFAALVSVAESMRNPLGCLRINGEGTLRVLEAARRAGVQKVVLASSAAVYGNNPVSPKEETMVPEPLSPYAVTKLDGEYYGALYTNEYSLPTAALRFFNVYGPGQDPNSPYAAAVPAFMTRARAGEPLSIHGDGGQTRDFIHVTDVARACLHCALEPTLTGVFNVGTGTAIAILQLAETVRRLSGKDLSIRFTTPRAGDVRHSVASITRLLASGFLPRYDLSTGLEATWSVWQETLA